MALNDFLVSDFVKSTKVKQKKTENTVLGTVRKDDKGNYAVQLDGSNILTPVTSTVSLSEKDRVTVLIKNHSAVVTGNLTDKSASSNTVTEVEGTANDAKDIANEAKTLLGKWTFKSEDGRTTINGGQIETGTITADKIDIEELFSKNITMTGKFKTELTTHIPPTVETYRMLEAIINDPNVYNPNGELTALYDLNCDGVINDDDLHIMRSDLNGEQYMEYTIDLYGYAWEEGKLNLEIDLTNPRGAITISGNNQWGHLVFKQFGVQSWLSQPEEYDSDLEFLLRKNPVITGILKKIEELEANGGITVDSELSLTSTNPVQNKVVTAAIDDKIQVKIHETDSSLLVFYK